MPRRSRKWFKTTTQTGWRKTLSAQTRRQLLIKSHGGDLLAAARSALALSNVTTDKETKQKAHKDAMALFEKHRVSKRLQG